MVVKLLWIAVLLATDVLSIVDFPCKNDIKYHNLGICIIEKFHYDDLANLTEDSFPNATNLEFWDTYLPYFGVHVFEMLPADIQQLTFRDGFIREIYLQSSSSIERLRILNTDLVTLDTVSEPNYSLKQLSVRSPVYSAWSQGLLYMKALEVIDVAYCNFSYLSLDWFEGYENLRVLDVSKNRLQTIHSRPGLVMSTLEELYLWGNRLEFVWRFPDAFPIVSIVNLSENLWSCTWVTLARDAIRDQGIVVIDSDYSCKVGWVNNGGLCCRLHEDVNPVPGRANDDISSPSSWVVLADYILDDANDTVIGMRVGNSVVYLAKPLS
ncbi:uncharacterized protein LOC135705200 [Ochlerotatus camptorhynchus]|uniref:uncharacterized protein LOC135705200 n=1 Tax=Ochlerotatus camptorhynchus TaxID=644619 RepID=UPI0031E2EB87